MQYACPKLAISDLEYLQRGSMAVTVSEMVLEGCRLPTNLYDQWADGHLIGLTPGDPWIDRANFCIVAVDAGCTWTRAAKLYGVLLSISSIESTTVGCDWDLTCLMRDRRWQPLHRKILVRQVLGLCVTQLRYRPVGLWYFTSLMAQDLERIQARLQRFVPR